VDHEECAWQGEGDEGSPDKRDVEWWQGLTITRRSLIDQERYLVLEVLTSKMAHAGRERENTPVT
jgi:hypothetical protein